MISVLVLICITIVSLVVLLGPRLRLDVSGDPPQVPAAPEQLERWLAQREARHPDIIPGAHKEIVWANRAVPSRTRCAVVYVHGFSASRREIDPFPALVAEALEANLYYTRLSGHGSSDPDAMGRMQPSDWYRDALETLAIGRAIADRIIIVATSTGVTLATVLIERFPEDVAALVAVSPNYGPRNRAAWLTAGPWGVQLARLMMDDYLSWDSFNDQHERYWTTRYPAVAIAALMTLVSCGRRVRHREIGVPLIQFSAPGDQVIDYRWSIRVFERWGSSIAPPPARELVLVHDSTEPEQHVITGEIRSPENTRRLAARAVEFLHNIGVNR